MDRGRVEKFEANFYDLLDGLIMRTPWASEAEALRYRELVAKLREVNVFGYMATQQTIEQERKL